MPIDKFLQYERAIEKITGIETLRQLEVAIFPKLKVNDQKTVRKKYETMIGVQTGETKRFEDAISEMQSWQMKR